MVEATGYKHVGLNGNSGPVVVVAKGAKAAAIRTALAGLSPSSRPLTPGCMDSGLAFKVSFLLALDHVRPIWRLRRTVPPRASY